MFKNSFYFFLRFLATLLISPLLCIVISSIASMFLEDIMTLIPLFFTNLFNFSSSDVASAVCKDMLFRGWGQLSAIGNDPNLSVRMAVLTDFMVFVGFFIIVFLLSKLLNKIIRENRFLTTLFLLFVILFFLKLVLDFYYPDTFHGIERGIGFYICSIIILFFTALFYYIIFYFICKKIE